MRNTHFICILSILLIYSCSNSNVEEYHTFTREGVPVKNIDEEEIHGIFDDEDEFNLASYYKYNDSICIKFFDSNELVKHDIIVFENSNSNVKKGYFRFGHGHNEVMGPMINVDRNYVILNDVVNRKAYVLDIDSVFNENYTPKIYTKLGLYMDFGLLSNGNLLATNTYFYNYLSCEDKFNVDTKQVAVSDNENQFNDLMAYKDFVANYGGDKMAVNENKDRVICFGKHLPEITVMNTKLKIIKTVVGPDVFDIQFSKSGRDPKPNGSYRAYKSRFYDNDYIYMLYEGKNGNVKKEEQEYPWEVLKFDWDANLIAIYRLKYDLYRMVVIDNVLYGSHRNQVKKKYYKFDIQ